MSTLSNEEKEVILRVINQKQGLLSAFIDFLPYIIPSLALSIYGLIDLDFLATFVAYSILLSMVVFYIIYTERSGKLLRLALQKYESEAKLL